MSDLSVDPSAIVAAAQTNRDARFQLSILVQYIAQAYGYAGDIGKSGVSVLLPLFDLFSGTKPQETSNALAISLLDAVSQREQNLYDSLPDDGDLLSDEDRARVEDVVTNAVQAIDTVVGAQNRLTVGFADAATTGVKLAVSKVLPTLPPLPGIGPVPIWVWLAAAAIGAVVLYRKVMR